MERKTFQFGFLLILQEEEEEGESKKLGRAFLPSFRRGRRGRLGPRRSYRPIQSVECPDLSARPNLAAKSRRVSHRPIRPPAGEHGVAVHWRDIYPQRYFRQNIISCNIAIVSCEILL